ncbi:Acyl_transf_3 domain-containing protein [Azospirillaceae bacterium]
MKNSSVEFLRLLAMTLITAQHAASVIGAYETTTIGPLQGCWGQFGVSVFMAISGWYSIGNDSPGRWFVKRLMRLFPTYWIVTIFAFALAWKTGRSFSGFQVLSQLFGLGFFTHGWNLVNVVSWYISLLLLCYAITALSRFFRRPTMILALAGGSALLLLLAHVEISLSRHVIAYCLAAAAATLGKQRLLPIAAAALLTLTPFSASICYAVFGLTMLWIALNLQTCSRWSFHRTILFVSDYVYEYFLIHGICLVGAAKAISNPAAAIAAAIIVAAMGAPLLRRTTEWTTTFLLGLTKKPS